MEIQMKCAYPNSFPTLKSFIKLHLPREIPLTHPQLNNASFLIYLLFYYFGGSSLLRIISNLLGGNFYLGIDKSGNSLIYIYIYLVSDIESADSKYSLQ